MSPLTIIAILSCSALIAHSSAALTYQLPTKSATISRAKTLPQEPVSSVADSPKFEKVPQGFVIGSGLPSPGYQGSSRGSSNKGPEYPALPNARDRCHSSDFMTMCSSGEALRDVQCRQRCRRPRMFGFSKGFGQACYCCECL